MRRKSHSKELVPARNLLPVGAVFVLLAVAACGERPADDTLAEKYSGWSAFGGTPDYIKYSALNQINTGNVHRLEIAWTFVSGDGGEGLLMQTNPLLAEGLLYVLSPKIRVFALDPGTGEAMWSHDPMAPEWREKPASPRYKRGLMYWPGDGERRARIYTAADKHLVALDARTGEPVEEFGHSGRIDLREGLGRDPESLYVYLTSPGVVFEDLIIVGSAVPEAFPSAPGHIRAFDARTGEIRWVFHTIPHPGEKGHDTWPPGAWKTATSANAWSGASLDEERGLVFLATGSASYDFYGGARKGDNLFANSVLALDARTGALKWHYQIVRHDLWDWDLPAPPTLVTIKRNGRKVDAVAQITKSGHVFVLDRETGEPLFPVEEREVPASTMEGEFATPTQTLPLKPAPFATQELTRDKLTKRTPEAHAAVSKVFDELDQRGLFTPPGLQGHAMLPGMSGGGQWGGGAFDPQTGYFYVNSNNMPWLLKLVPQNRPEDFASIRDVYLAHCASCHGEKLEGNPPTYPALKDLISRYWTPGKLMNFIRDGTSRMPGYDGVLDRETQRALAEYLLYGADVALDPESLKDNPAYVPYRLEKYQEFLDPDGYPAIEPPWGELSAIDLNTGEYVWRQPFGEYPELVAKGMGATGSQNYGGGVVTAGGLFIIGATVHDKKIRAFDKLTGELLWQAELPAANNATPAVYEWEGRQFIVVAAGGSRATGKGGDAYVAFALPEAGQRQ